MKRIFFSLLLCFIAGPVFSQQALVCNGCSETQVRNYARSNGVGDYYFYDFQYRSLTHAMVDDSVNSFSLGKGNVPIGGVTIVPLTSAESAVRDAVLAYYDQAGGILDPVTSIPVDVALSGPAAKEKSYGMLLSQADSQGHINAMDVVTTPAYRSLALNAVEDDPDHRFESFTANVYAALSSILHTVQIEGFAVVPVEPRVTMAFVDGSTAVAQYNFATGHYAYVPYSAKDSAGNSIPENLQDVTGNGAGRTYVYPPTPAGLIAALDMVDRLSSLGASTGGLPADASSGINIFCSNVGSVTSCQVSTMNQ